MTAIFLGMENKLEEIRLLRYGSMRRRAEAKAMILKELDGDLYYFSRDCPPKYGDEYFLDYTSVPSEEKD